MKLCSLICSFLSFRRYPLFSTVPLCYTVISLCWTMSACKIKREFLGGYFESLASGPWVLIFDTVTFPEFRWGFFAPVVVFHTLNELHHVGVACRCCLCFSGAKASDDDKNNTNKFNPNFRFCLGQRNVLKSLYYGYRCTIGSAIIYLQISPLNLKYGNKQTRQIENRWLQQWTAPVASWEVHPVYSDQF